MRGSLMLRYVIIERTELSFCTYFLANFYTKLRLMNIRTGPTSMIITALDNTSAISTQSARTDTIVRICQGLNGTCFAEIQRIQSTNFRALRTLSREPEICISEPGSPTQPLYCLPVFDAAAAVHVGSSVFDVVSI